MTSTPSGLRAVPSGELFLVGFFATWPIPFLLTLSLWFLRTFFSQENTPLFWIALGILTWGFHQWLYVLPICWALRRKAWRNLRWGILLGAFFVLMVNLLVIAYFIFSFPRFD